MSPRHYCNRSVKVRAVYHWNEMLANCQSCQKWAKAVRFLLASNELSPFNAFANVYSSFWYFCILRLFRLFRICLHCNCQLCQNSDALSIVAVKANKKSKVFTAVKVNRSKKSQYCRWQKINKQNSFWAKFIPKFYNNKEKGGKK